MDEIDVKLFMYLAMNSRIPYRELADKLNISVTAVYNRIRVLKELGVIDKFITWVDFKALKGFPVAVFGRSETKSLEETIQVLGKSMYTWKIFSIVGNYLFVIGILHDISELEKYSNFVKSEGKIYDPLVLTMDMAELSGPVNLTLNELDYKIIYSLLRNSRKSLSKVAKELGISQRTVRRRLSAMEKDGSIRCSIDWNATTSNDIISFIHLSIKGSMDKKDVVSFLANKYFPRVFDINTASNIPNSFVLVVWTRTMNDIKVLQDKLKAEEFVDNLILYVLYDIYYFDTWRDDIIRKKAYPNDK